VSDTDERFQALMARLPRGPRVEVVACDGVTPEHVGERGHLVNAPDYFTFKGEVLVDLDDEDEVRTISERFVRVLDAVTMLGEIEL